MSSIRLKSLGGFIKKEKEQKIDKTKFDKLSSALKQNLKRRKMSNKVEEQVLDEVKGENS